MNYETFLKKQIELLDLHFRAFIEKDKMEKEILVKQILALEKVIVKYYWLLFCSIKYIPSKIGIY